MSSVYNQQQHQSSDQVAQDIPADLKLLLRTVMRTFYSFELYLCMEMLMLYPCCKEDDLAELLRLDLKTLQQHLKNLKKEKFISEKALMETSSDGSKQCKHAYYFINYKMLVNIVKYKLDRIRLQIETEDKQFTTRAQFKCTQCMKTYTDLDTKDIFLTMRCVYCGADVDEDSSTLPASRQNGQRNLIHTFNTQMAVIFELLSKVEHIRLADHLLRPDPIDLSYILERNQAMASGGSANSNGSSSNPNNHSNLIFNKSSSTSNLGGGGRANMIKYDKWSGDKTRNLDLLAQTKVSINFDSADGSGGQTRKPQKELPSILLLNRTQEEDEAALSRDRDSILLSQVKLAADETLLNSQSNMLKSPPSTLTKSATTATLNPAATTAAGVSNTGNFGGASGPGVGAGSNTTGANLEQCIMQMLLKHEKKTSDQVVSSPSSTSSASNGASLPPPPPPISSSNGISSISISKKRALDGSEGNGFHSESDLNEFYKKRKLGDGLEEKHNGFGSNGYNNKQYSNNLKRIYSDGSENSDEYEDDDYNHQFDDDANFGDSMNVLNMNDEDVNARRVYDSYDSYENSMNQLTIGSTAGDLVNSKFIPRVSVQNRSIRFDRITPKLIGLMSPPEKENYINLCRQLYTEIYEI